MHLGRWCAKDYSGKPLASRSVRLMPALSDAVEESLAGYVHPAEGDEPCYWGDLRERDVIDALSNS